MLIVNRFVAGNRDRPWLCQPEKLVVNQALTIVRGDKPETLAVNYITDASVGWTTSHDIGDKLAVSVTAKGRPAYDLFIDEKHIRRPVTRPGSLSICDFRVLGCGDLRAIPLDNTIVFIPFAALDDLADELRVPRVDVVENLFAEDRVDQPFLHLVEIIKLAIERPSEANLYFIEHILGELRSHVAFTYGRMAQPKPQRRGTLTPLQEQRVKAQLLERLADPPNPKELASSCGLSISHFNRAFKESTGLPPHRWLLTQRVERAKDLLRKTTTPVIEVALGCGFADQSHLTRVFSKAVGMGPALWRRNVRD
jgi:AraC family transcriptional regulator